MVSSEHQSDNTRKEHGFKMRHIQCLLLFFGLAASFGVRVNLSLAIVAMTDAKTNEHFPSYDWSEKIKSFVLSSFFCGYIVTQLPAGHLAKKFGSKNNILLGVLISCLITVFIPMAVKIGNWPLLIAVRGLTGIFQGILIPSIHTFLSNWAPAEERSIMSIIIYSGAQFGTVFMLASSGFLASSALGWPSIFYLPGVFGVLWSFLWYIFGASKPSDCKYITTEELDFIEHDVAGDLGETNGSQKLNFPVLKVLTSIPFYMLILVHCSFAWGYWTLLTQLPNYMKNIFGMNIKSNALLSSLPYFTKFVLGLVFSGISKLLTKYKCLKLATSRKLFNTIAFWCPGLTLIALGYIDASQPVLAIILLTLTVGLGSASYLGFVVNHIDLAPNFAGILMGITNFVANINSLMAPLVVGFVVTDVTSVVQWRIIFFIAAIYQILANLLFILFGSVEVQPWNNPNGGAVIVPTSEENKKMEAENMI